MIIRYELQDFDILEIKIKQLKKDYKEVLSKKESERDKEILIIIHRLIETDQIKKDKILYNKIQSVLNSEDQPAEGDNEIINYKNWLREKIS